MARKLTDEQVVEIIRLYVEEKCGTTKLVEMYHVDRATIVNYLKKNNIEIRPRKFDIKPGTKFNRWTVIEEAKKRGRTRYFLCECSCVNKTRKEIALGSLLANTSKSCGCLIGETAKTTRRNIAEDVIGKTYGRLTVLSEDIRENSKDRHVWCKCSCNGNIDVYNLSRLRNGTTTSCGCYAAEKTRERSVNRKKYFNYDQYIGKIYGRLKILEFATEKCTRSKVICKCSCDDEIIKKIRLDGLLSGAVISCGCYQREIVKEKAESFIGCKFGRLTVICDIEDEKFSNRRVLAKCDCDGNIKGYFLNSLKNGMTTSCGCYNKEVQENKAPRKKDLENKYPFFCKVEEVVDNPDGPGILVKCKNNNCGKLFRPTYRQLDCRINAVENVGRLSLGTENNFYCSDECKHSCLLFNLRSDPFERKEVSDNVPTSNELKIWSDEVLKRQYSEYGYNFCTKCQGEDNLAAHHIDPKKIEPFYALDPENGIVFCRDCHLNDAHSGTCSTGALANKVCK